MKTTDHRKINRFSCLVPVEGKKDSVFDDVHSVDISRAGLGLVSKNKFSVNQRIAVEVELGGQEPVLMLAEVRWIKPVSASGTYRIGMKFIQVLSSGSRSHLTRYLGEKNRGRSNGFKR